MLVLLISLLRDFSDIGSKVYWGTIAKSFKSFGLVVCAQIVSGIMVAIRSHYGHSSPLYIPTLVVFGLSKLKRCEHHPELLGELHNIELLIIVLFAVLENALRSVFLQALAKPQAILEHGLTQEPYLQDISDRDCGVFVIK